MASSSAMDPFETLGVAPSFSLDVVELGERQRELSKALHPDRFVGRPAGERRQALGRAIEVNQAHRVLKNPLTRAEALLFRLELALPEGQEPQAEPMFLMEVMELREALRDAGRARDSAKVQRLASQVRGDEEALGEQLAANFAAVIDQGAGADSALAREIHQNLGKLRYLRRFLDEAEAILDDIL